MKTIKRFCTVVLLCMLVVLCGGSPIMAIDQVPNSELSSSGINPSPMFMYINQIYTSMYIQTYGDTTAVGSIIGIQGLTDEVWIFLYLERYINGSWQTYACWSKTFYSYRGYLEGTRVVPRGYSYRVRGSYYAWVGSNYEQVTGYSSVQYY
jgi:hypothetical protein